MRALFLAFVLTASAAPAFAQQAPGAQAAYAERRALLEADQRCTLFEPRMRASLQAAAGQARGALLRAGWTQTRLSDLDAAAVSAARSRTCGDTRTLQAAERARTAFDSWAHLHAMTFQGGERVWLARRTPDPADQWRLRQDIPAPQRAFFGVRESGQTRQLTFILPLANGASAPATAELVIRDRARAPLSLMDVPGRTARGLSAGAPAQATSRTYLAQARRIETIEGARRAVFVFPGEALSEMAALDPREAGEIRLGGRNTPLLIEIGDLAAARAFLAADGSR
ncbi:MAG: hypothetical protein ABW199_10610 [Caulobacterales bacterium]